MKNAKWIAILLAVLVLSGGVLAEEFVPYTVDELDMEISLPTAYNYVFTRDSGDDDPILADWGVTKEELFANDDIYLEALTEDQNDELIVMMMRTDWSEMYADFNDLSKEELLDLAEYSHSLVVSDGDINVAYDTYEVFEGQRQVPFIKATGRFQNDDTAGDVIQYVTVLNGQFYIFSFNFYAGNEGQGNRCDDVISALTFQRIAAAERGGNEAVYIAVIGVLCAVIVALLAVIRKQKYSLKRDVAADRQERDPEEAD